MYRLTYCLMLLCAGYIPAGESPLKVGTFTAQLEDRVLAYTVAGQGPPMMVLTNSWGIEKEALRAMFGGLETQFTLIYFDLRGMGGSSPLAEGASYGIAETREDLHLLRTYLKLEKIFLLGWSAGAMNGLVYAGDHADDLLGAVLIHGISYLAPADAETFKAEHGAFFARQQQVLGTILKSDQPPVGKNEALKQFMLTDWFPYICADREKGVALLAPLAQSSFSWPHMFQSFGELGTFDGRSSLPKITCPTLVIAGAHDLLPPRFLERDAKTLPRATYVVMEKSGHFSMMEEPDHFLEVVRTWRKGL